MGARLPLAVGETLPQGLVHASRWHQRVARLLTLSHVAVASGLELRAPRTGPFTVSASPAGLSSGVRDSPSLSSQVAEGRAPVSPTRLL